MEECLSISSLLAGQTDYVRCQATILRQLLLKGSFDKGDFHMLEEKARWDSTKTIVYKGGPSGHGTLFVDIKSESQPQ